MIITLIEHHLGVLCASVQGVRESFLWCWLVRLGFTLVVLTVAELIYYMDDSSRNK